MSVVLKETRQWKDTVLSKITVTTQAGLEIPHRLQGLCVDPKKVTRGGRWTGRACGKAATSLVALDPLRTNQALRRKG